MDSFAFAVARYQAGEFSGAAKDFVRLFKDTRRCSIAVNAVGALVKAEEPKRATNFLSGSDRKLLSNVRSFGWQLAYNLAIAFLQAGNAARAIRILQEQLGRFRHRGAQWEITARPGPLTKLLVAICVVDTPPTQQSRDTLAQALESVRKANSFPTEELLVALAWTRLAVTPSDLEGTREVLEILISGAEGRVLPPAVEIMQARQVRDAYKYLSENKGIAGAVEYLEEIVATKVSERQGGTESLDSEHLVRGIGTETTARLCLADAHYGSGRLSESVEMLHEAEGILLDHGNKLPRGFLAIDWLELTRTAQILGLPWATLRFLNEGLATDPDREDLRSIEADVRASVESEHAVGLITLAHQLSDVSFEHTGPAKQVIALLKERLGLKPTHPYTILLYSECTTLFNALAKPDPDSGTIEEMADRLAATARILLSEDAYRTVKNIVNWILRHWGTESTQLPADVRIHDDTVWPRRDDARLVVFLLSPLAEGTKWKD